MECQWNVILFDSLEMRVGLVGIFRMQPNATRFIQTCLKYKSSHLNVCGVLDDLRLSHFAIPSTRLQKSFVCASRRSKFERWGPLNLYFSACDPAKICHHCSPMAPTVSIIRTVNPELHQLDGTLGVFGDHERSH